MATDCSPILKDVLGNNGMLVPWGDIYQMSHAILNYKQYKEESKKFYSWSEFYKVIVGE